MLTKQVGGSPWASDLYTYHTGIVFWVCHGFTLWFRTSVCRWDQEPPQTTNTLPFRWAKNSSGVCCICSCLAKLNKGAQWYFAFLRPFLKDDNDEHYRRAIGLTGGFSWSRSPSVRPQLPPHSRRHQAGADVNTTGPPVASAGKKLPRK